MEIRYEAEVKRALALAVIAAAMLNPSAVAQKKPKTLPEPPQTYPTEQTFHSPCDAVWPVAVQTIMAAGWSVKTSDRAGGILMLEWTKGEWWGNVVAPKIRENTLEQATAFKHQWHTFRIISASVISAPEGANCTYAVSVVMHGDEVTKGWRVLQSNGFIENGILGRIESRLPK